MATGSSNRNPGKDIRINALRASPSEASRSSFATPIAAATVFFSAAAALSLRALRAEGLPDKAFEQLIAVCVVFALSSFILYSESREVRFAVYPVKLFCIFFVTRAVEPGISPFIFFLLAYTLETCCMDSPAFIPVLSIPALILIYAGSAQRSAWNELLSPGSAEVFYILVLSAAGAGLIGAVFVRSLKERNRLKAEIARLEEAVLHLASTNNAWQTYATYIEETSKDEERHRIAREIHDIVGYSMTNLLMLVQAALYSENQEKITELLQKAQAHINDSLEEVRTAMRKLRSTRKKALHGSDLFRYLAGNFSKVTGIRVTMEFISFPGKLTAEVEEAIYRMLQECMTNSFKHGKATRIGISFWFQGDELIAQIRDNGQKKTEEVHSEGIGIQGMRERIEAIGGRLSMKHEKDGYTVVAAIPLLREGTGQMINEAGAP